MRYKRVQQAAIIGGEDGPTSVFIAGKDDGFKIPLRARIRKKQYQIRRKRVEKKIKSGAHTIKETILYANEKYGLLPVEPTQLKYQNEKKSVKEAVIYKYKPELLGEFQHISAPDISDEKSMQEFYQLLEERERIIETISDEEISMDFKMYELVQENSHLEMVLDSKWNILYVNYGGDREQMRKLKKIAQDIYLYYGVTEEDIKNKTERYAALVGAFL